MTDKELLELAAKAAGYGEVWYVEGNDTAYVGPKYVFGEPIGYQIFNPLTDDGDALRLAVKLEMNVEVWNPFKEVWVVAEGYDVVEEPWGEDKLAATRRAIVRAAAEIGRGMG